MDIQAHPSLSIVIPVLNEATVLPDALKAFGALSVRSPDSIIFVDGGSTDQSRGLIEKAGFTCLQSEAGRAKQMNMGASFAKSDIILYLHIDTEVSSSNISNIKKSYKAGYIGGRFDISFNNDLLTYRIISFFINKRSRLTHVFTGDQGIFVRRDVFELLGGFPDIALMEDIAFTKKIRNKGKVACLTDTIITSSRRWEKHGVISTITLMWKLRLLYWLGVSPERLSTMYRDAR